MTGIYKIENIVTKKNYIGSSINVSSRKNRHFNDLMKGIHHSLYLQRSFDKYGQRAFVFSVIEYCREEELLEREQYYIDLLKPEYNNSKVAGNCLGVKHRPETVDANRRRNSGFGNGNCKINADILTNILTECNTNTTAYLAKKYGVHRSTIERALKKIGVKKEKVFYENTREKLSALAKQRRNRAKPVKQYNLNGELISRYPSMNEASKKTGVSITQIFACCNNKVKRPSRYRFTFERQA